MLDLELMKRFPEEDGVLNYCYGAFKLDRGDIVEALEDLKSVKNAGLSKRNTLGAAACVLYLAHDDSPRSAPLTQQAYSMFIDLADKEIATTSQCWNLVEELSRHYLDIAELFQNVVRFSALNIGRAPASAYANFDAMLRSGNVSSMILEIIGRLYLRRSSRDLDYIEFISKSYYFMKENRNLYGEDWYFRNFY